MDMAQQRVGDDLGGLSGEAERAALHDIGAIRQRQCTVNVLLDHDRGQAPNLVEDDEANRAIRARPIASIGCCPPGIDVPGEDLRSARMGKSV